jgi:CheY-like chemotaxis protein
MNADGSPAAKILVVDDDDQIRQIAVRQLTSLGYSVIQAANGPAALDLLGHGSDVDLLFVDLSMPDMDGHQVAKKARDLKPGIKIVFASGNFADDGGGDAQFLLKPYRKKDLAEKIHETLGTTST